MIQAIVSVSGGVSSSVAWKRAIERFGRNQVIAVFADTLIEDEDLYRFLDDCESYLEHKLTRIADGRTPFEVMRDERFLANTRVDKCSEHLKRRMIRRFEKKYPDALKVLGYKADEDDRIAKFRKRTPNTWFPLADEKPWLSDYELHQEVRSWGIEPPRLYAMGFAHNNCGGGCVKAGQAQWRHLLVTMPERYAMWEKHEQDMRAMLDKDIAYMRHRSGPRIGLPLTLKEFRERLEMQPLLFDSCDFGAACDCMGVLQEVDE